MKLHRYLIRLADGRRKFTWAATPEAALAKARGLGLDVATIEPAPDPLTDR